MEPQSTTQISSASPAKPKTSLGCLGFLGAVSLILLASCITTELLLKMIYPGDLVAVRLMFPFSFVERSLGSESRWTEKCLKYTSNFFSSYLGAFQANNDVALSRKELDYKPVMEFSAENNQNYFKEFIERKLTPGASQASFNITYPYLDYNCYPLVLVKTKKDLLRFFPYLLDGLRGSELSRDYRSSSNNPSDHYLDSFPSLPVPGGELVSISLAYSYNQFGQRTSFFQKKMKWGKIFFWFFFIVFSCPFFFSMKTMIRLPLRLFALIYPIAFLMEITQPMCYSPARGRFVQDNPAEIKSECQRVIAELAKDGTIDVPTQDLLKKALEDPKNLLSQE